MEIKAHQINKINVAEVISDEIIISNWQDGLDLLGSLYYQEFDKIVLQEKNITPDFFDLKTGIAGEILQKCANFRMNMAIVGDFSKYKSKSLKAFIFESNKMEQINFVGNLTDALNSAIKNN
ncbi:MAG: hypothetical protein RLZZ306_2236 [Bacteroidota bacterium]|jgi:hypothetical protein